MFDDLPSPVDGGQAMEGFEGMSAWIWNGNGRSWIIGNT